jgi:hypothetical protein
MEISLTNYQKILSKELLKVSEKNTVRECDELEKGHFQAYVDEKGNDSYDVLINLNNRGIVTDYSCDCKSKGSFCRHTTALLRFISTKGNVATRVSKTVKINPLENLVQNADPDKLKIWLKELLVKNKDLELAFMHQFADTEKRYTPADIKKATADAVKAIIKNKKNIEPSEAKRIAALWAEIHETQLAQYCAAVADENDFQNLNALVEACEETLVRIVTNSNKLYKYITDTLSKITQPVHDLKDETAWDKATGFFVARMNVDYFKPRIHYLLFLSGILDISDSNRKKRLISKLVTQYAQTNLQKCNYSEAYTNIIFSLVKNNDLFPEYSTIFKPILFKNEYNKELITLLIRNNQVSLAEKYCREQIKGNFKKEYNTPYLQLLKEIYTIKKDDLKLAEVLAELFPLTFDFDDFLFIYDRIKDEEEKKKWRTKMFTKARNTSYGQNSKGILFSFQLLDYEEKYKKMIELINSNTRYDIIAKYADKMLLTDKAGFVHAIMNKDDSFPFRYSSAETENEVVFAELSAILLKHYSKKELIMIIEHRKKSSYYYRLNDFLAYLVKQHLS